MSVALLLVTHGRIGQEMVARTVSNLGPMPQEVQCVSVRPDDDPDTVFESALAAAEDLDAGEGVLVISDLYGATPGNICQRLAGNPRIHVIHGLNLAMLTRAHNYPDLPLEELCSRLLEGARRGVVDGGTVG